MSQQSQRRRRGRGNGPYRERPDPEQLLSARQAAIQLGINPRTAQLRAKRAMVAGDTAVRPVAGAYVAPQAWWVHLLLAEPIRTGRPPIKVLHLLDPDVWHWECMIGAAGDPEHEAALHAQQLARRRFLYRQKKAAALVGE